MKQKTSARDRGSLFFLQPATMKKKKTAKRKIKGQHHKK
jgi:hypothetical protein